jgi:hypothetical protein
MLFMSLYTPATLSSAPPSAEHMTKMIALVERMTKAGALVATGGIMSRNTAMKIVLKGGKHTVENGAIAGSTLMPAAGYAILRANSREELAKNVKEFLEVAGDGTCELIQLLDGPPPTE